MPQPHRNVKFGIAGYFSALYVGLVLCSCVAVIVPPIGLAIFLLWLIPSAVHSGCLIARQGRYLPLPWEDQFAAVLVSAIFQIPLWLTSGFLGFVLGALVFDYFATNPISQGNSLSYATVWFFTSLGIYLSLFVVTIFQSFGKIYRHTSEGKRTSIRDAKPIYHPF